MCQKGKTKRGEREREARGDFNSYTISRKKGRGKKERKGGKKE